jgi:para-nitrobenzyl esterase
MDRQPDVPDWCIALPASSDNERAIGDQLKEPARMFLRSASAGPDVETKRKLVQGEIVGFRADNGAHVWRGIPYGASTAGANRWRAPQAPLSWSGVRETVAIAERCAQLTNEFDADEGLPPGIVVGSEDCLTLDIYAPSAASGESLPVMAWIHGGGNVWGRSGAYDGSQLCLNEKVIVVAVQYRVGPLGWFAHNALRDTALEPEDASASFATLDLIASLKWVRDNIEIFGGNPGSVTIFGESAGGHNVATLLASPLAKGLFHRAIIQSGSFDSTPLVEAEGVTGDRANTANEIARKLNVTTAQELREIPVDRLLLAYEHGRGFVDVPRVIEDGVVLPGGPLRDAFASLDTFHPVPIITGTNRDEMKLFYLRDPRLTKKVLWLFAVARDQSFYDLFTNYITRLWRIRSVDEPAQMLLRAGHGEVYAYRFDWDDGGRLLFMDFKKMLGAAHGFELPFVFNRFQHLGRADRVLFQSRTLQDRERLSSAIGHYWASFARDGVPSCPGEAVWPVYGSQENFLRLDAQNDGGIELANGSDSVDALLADIRNDDRLDNLQREFLADEMCKWMFADTNRDRIKSGLTSTRT